MPRLPARLLPASLRGAAFLRVSQTPVLGRLAELAHPARRRIRVTRRTAVLVEGFPRSGNSWLFAAFRQLVDDETRVAGFRHAPRTLARAERLGVPRVLVLRRPDDAVRSALTFDPATDARRAYAAYATFHQQVVRRPAGVLVVPFEVATTDLAAVLAAADERFGTDWGARRRRLDPRDDPTLDPAALFATIDDHVAVDDPARLARLSRPVAGRRHAALDLDDRSIATERARALAAYEALLPPAVPRQPDARSRGRHTAPGGSSATQAGPDRLS